MSLSTPGPSEDHMTTPGRISSVTDARAAFEDAASLWRVALPHALEIIAQHRRQIEKSPGIGVERQTYALDVLDDIESDLRAAALSGGSAPAVEELHRIFSEAWDGHEGHGEDAYGAALLAVWRAGAQPASQPPTEEER